MPASWNTAVALPPPVRLTGDRHGSRSPLHLLRIAVVLAVATCPGLGRPAAGSAAIRNPGFELLNPAGDNFPLGWTVVRGPAGRSSVAIDPDAAAGSVSVRLESDECGVAGVNGEPLAVRRGRISFRYRAIESSLGGTNLIFDIIALGGSGAEVPGRTRFRVPAEHVGDGRWHEGTVDFDFTANPAVTAILPAPRINEATEGGAGIWLIDEIACEERLLGPRATIEAFHLETPVPTVGESVTLVAQVANTGDGPLAATTVLLELPADCRIVAGERGRVAIDPLQAGDWRRIIWRIAASRPLAGELGITWQGGPVTLHRSRPLWCVERRNPREECTDAAGFWRPFPSRPTLQRTARRRPQPLVPVRSKDLPDSCIGLTAHLPRSGDFERIFEPEHLVDGDPATSWSGRGYAAAVPGPAETVVVRFPEAAPLAEIRLVPYHRGEAFPLDFSLDVLRGGEWATVHEARAAMPPTGDTAGGGYVVPLDAGAAAEAVRLVATRLRPAASFFTECATSHFLRLAAVEALTAEGVDAARGGRVEVAGTFRSFYNTPDVIRRTYPELYDLGVKWNRVGQWGDRTAWAMVESRRGEFHVDPETDRAISESVANGVQILLTLCYGNPLYEETPWLADPGPVWRQGHPFTGSGGPTRPEAITGFARYARFLATHFRGRVKHYEIWNEPNSWAWYGMPPDATAYGALVRETIAALKEVDPEIEVSLGGTAALAPEWLAAALAAGGRPSFDALAFHPYTMATPELGVGALDVIAGRQAWRPKEELGYSTYPEMLAYLRHRLCPDRPHVALWANEWNVVPTRELSPYQGQSEIVEAKQAARFFLVNTLCGVRAVWWSLANENTGFDWAVLRTGDLSRKPVYYVIQAAATLLSGARPARGIAAIATGDLAELRCEPLKHRDGGLLVALWSAAPPGDDTPAAPVTLTIPDAGGRPARAVDLLHGIEQPLETRASGRHLVVADLLVGDWPLVVHVQ